MKKVLIQLSAALCLLMTSAALSAQTVEESQVTLLDYISSTGAQAFNTGFTHSANTRVEMDCYVVKDHQRTWEALLGARLGSYQSNAFCFFSRTDGQDVPCFNRTGEEPRGEGFVYFERIKLVCERQTATWYRQSAPNTPAGSVTTTGLVDYGRTPMLLFDLNTSNTDGGVTEDGSRSVMMLYGCKIYEGTALIRDYVPAKYNGTVGLYDRVNKTFGGSITSTPFEEINEVQDAYMRALSTVVDEKNYRVFTMYGGQKYYITANGYLSTNVDEAPAFVFHKVRGEEFGYGFMIRNGFFNFTNPEEENDAALTKGHLNVTNVDARHTWEAQVLFLNSEGKYAIRTTNAQTGNSGWNKVGSAFWTVNAGASGPLAEYSYDMNYVWQLEEAPSNAPTPDEELLVNGSCDGTFDGWTKTDGGSGWEIATEDGRIIWASSYQLCTLTQTVTLADHNISGESVDDGNVWVTASAEMKSKTFKDNLGAKECKVIVTMLDANGQTLGTVKLIDDQTYYPYWDTYRTVPFQLASGTRRLQYYVSGQDAVYWGGTYGPRFANLSLKAIVDDGTAGERYPVWVGSTRVTSANMNDVLGDGSVSYTPGEGAGTLTFNNPTPTIAGTHSWKETLDAEVYNYTAKIFADGIDLTINAPEGLTIGSNAELDAYGIITTDESNLTIDGNFNFTSGGGAIYLAGQGDLTVNGNFNSTSIRTGFMLRNGDVRITGDVYVKTTSTNHTSIFLNNGYLYIGPSHWEIESGLDVAFAKITTEPFNPGSIVIPSTHEIIYPQGGKLSDDNRGFMNTIATGGVKHVTIWQKSELYPVWLGDTRVTKQNQNDILGDGSVSFTPGEGAGTLTFTNPTPTINGSHVPTKPGAGNALQERAKIYSEGIDLTINAPDGLTISAGNEEDINAIYIAGEGNLTFNGNLTVASGDCGVNVDNGSMTINGNFNCTTFENGFYVMGGDARILGDVYVKTTSTLSTTLGTKNGYLYFGPGRWEVESGLSVAYSIFANDVSMLGGLVIPYTHRITYPDNAVVSDDYRGILTTNGKNAKHVIIAPVGDPTVIDLSTLTADCVAQDNTTITGTMSGFYKVSIADGAIVTLRNVTINKQPESNDGNIVNFWDANYRWAGITCEGSATILLEGENTVKGFSNEFPGIHVPENKTLVIDGTGKLNATGGGIPSDDSYATMSAGIGGGYDLSCGNIRIRGGDITATAEHFAAGIGCGMSENSDVTCGNIYIYGGTVTATGGFNGAGIGSGYSNGRPNTCGTIHIYGGTVTAISDDGGAGIGSGGGGINETSCGSIFIDSGKITAASNYGGAGIGSGMGDNSKSTCSLITIRGGDITATGGNGAAGIGSGMGYEGESACGIIQIDNATVTATSIANAPGIGSGRGISQPSTCANVIINSGVVNATGDRGGAGIGSGVANEAESQCGLISIHGGVVTAIGDSAPGIGSGYADNSKSSCGFIIIEGGTVTATGGAYSAGIGTGYKNGEEAESSCNGIEIFNEITRVTATAGPVDDPSQAAEPIGVSLNGICYGDIKIGDQLTDIVNGLTRTLFIGTTGDVNADGEVNVSDVTMLVSMILGNTPQASTADVNGDGEVNVSDVTALVSIILNN